MCFYLLVGVELKKIILFILGCLLLLNLILLVCFVESEELGLLKLMKLYLVLLLFFIGFILMFSFLVNCLIKFMYFLL